MKYLVRLTLDIYTDADSPEEAIKQIESGIEDEPLYGPFNYEILCTTCGQHPCQCNTPSAIAPGGF